MSTDIRFTEAEIQAAVEALGARIASDYAGRRPLLVGVLKGVFVFLADLVRAIELDVDVEFIRARSYGDEMVSSGHVEIVKDVELDPAGRDVLVVEDIVDSARTLEAVVAHLGGKHPATLRTCALVRREGARLTPDYVGLTTGPGFLVGYGLDHAERQRGLRDIRVIG
ncbi:MAG: hypoxanthine phosphoribosyltransferase [Planctomycetota bacterium]|nr:hypoxanthine phosphoribosyltransferase [Planctomycetota bacterium]